MIYKRIYKWSVFITALASFCVWYLMGSVEISNIDDHIQKIIKIGVSAVFSYGFFVGIVSLSCYLIDNCKCIKRLFFASSYIEGVWIGFCILKEKKEDVVLDVQQIEQISSGVSVCGQTFIYDGGDVTFRGTWRTTGTSFDNIRQTLNCTYVSNKVDGVNAGFLSYQFIKLGKKVPEMVSGYIGNYSPKGKIVFLCKRYFDLEHMPDMQSYINIAKAFYNEHKNYFDYYKNIPDGVAE